MGRELRQALLFALALGLVLELILVPTIHFWPDFRRALDESQSMAQMLGNMGGQFREMLDAITGDSLEAVAGVAAERTGAVMYVCLQHFFKACSTLGTAAAVLFAVSAVAGEAQRGTLEIMLARPIPRWRLLVERWLLGAAALLAPIFATTATIPHLMERIGESIHSGRLMLCATHQGLALMSIYAFAFLVSTLGQRPVRIAVILLFFFILEFALYFVDTATEWSLFRLADLKDYQSIFSSGHLDWTHCLGFLGFTSACLAASLYAFHRRIP